MYESGLCKKAKSKSLAALALALAGVLAFSACSADTATSEDRSQAVAGAQEDDADFEGELINLILTLIGDNALPPTANWSCDTGGISTNVWLVALDPSESAPGSAPWKGITLKLDEGASQEMIATDFPASGASAIPNVTCDQIGDGVGRSSTYTFDNTITLSTANGDVTVVPFVTYAGGGTFGGNSAEDPGSSLVMGVDGAEFGWNMNLNIGALEHKFENFTLGAQSEDQDPALVPVSCSSLHDGLESFPVPLSGATWGTGQPICFSQANYKPFQAFCGTYEAGDFAKYQKIVDMNIAGEGPPLTSSQYDELEENTAAIEAKMPADAPLGFSREVKAMLYDMEHVSNLSSTSISTYMGMIVGTGEQMCGLS